MRILALDIGEKRVGMAYADSNIRIAVPRSMVAVDGNEYASILAQARRDKVDLILSGLPRNNSGEETRQTQFAKDFVAKLQAYCESQGETKLIYAFQDESWTSEVAKDHIAAKKHAITRRDRDTGAVDIESAAIILQDFLEGNRLYEYEQKITQG